MRRSGQPLRRIQILEEVPMSNISAQLVKELRERSGAGMMECKKALVENNGDIEIAMEWLRKSGLAKADKKASRVAAEGRIVAAQAGKAVLVEVNCETDFVGKDASFLKFSDTVADVALKSGAADVDALKAAAYPGASNVEEAAKALIATIGEKIDVRRMAASRRRRDRQLHPWRPHRRAGRAQGRLRGAGQGHRDARRRDEPGAYPRRGRTGRFPGQGKGHRAEPDVRQGKGQAGRNPGEDHRRQDQQDRLRSHPARPALRAGHQHHGGRSAEEGRRGRVTVVRLAVGEGIEKVDRRISTPK
jgi:hypothetical protein